jgi:hypothetical protein
MAAMNTKIKNPVNTIFPTVNIFNKKIKKQKYHFFRANRR